MHTMCCSAWPLVVGWKGGEWTWQILFLVVESRNSPKVKGILLSDTSVSGKLRDTNSFLSARMADTEEVELMTLTSSHLEYQSMVTIKVWPWNDLMKSTCMRTMESWWLPRR